ncbi:MAG TPA: amino acid adenylation domain-containing protein [Thermoanaerobaculia bacterium]|nr:amino acid adenylation domain-containing protein [Thermoanaerobaculia bacterium]
MRREATLVSRATFALSPQQAHLWHLQGGGPPGGAQGAVNIAGALAAQRLRAALEDVVARHDILRSELVPAGPGELPTRRVHNGGGAAVWRQVDLAALGGEQSRAALAALLAAERRGLARRRGYPPLGACLARLGPSRHILLLTLPALCADRPTLALLTREVATAYACPGAAADDEPVQYWQFADWLHELRHGEDAALGESYWRAPERGAAAEAALPWQRRAPESAGGDFLPGSCTLSLPLGDACGGRDGPPLEAWLLACWQALLARLAERREIVVGVVCDGRSHAALQRGLGPYARCLPVAGRLTPGLRLRELAGQLTAALAEGREWQEFFAPEPSVAARGGGPPPLAWQFEMAPAAPPYLLDGVRFALANRSSYGERFILKLLCAAGDGDLELELQYDRGRLARAAVESFAALLASLVTGGSRDAALGVDDVGLLAAAEREELAAGPPRGWQWSLPEGGFHRQFEAQVRRSPDSPAVVGGGEELSYRELNRRANRLAHRLRGMGVGPEARVGLLLDRSADAIAALLGTLKAGGAYAFIDPAQPAERLAALLAELAPAVLVVDATTEARLPGGATRPTIRLDAGGAAPAPEPDGEPDGDPDGGATPDNLAYVMFTSGSTGLPKGVAIAHRQLLHYVAAIAERLPLGAGASFASVSSLAADLGHTAIFPCLCTGGVVHVVAQEALVDPPALAAYFTRHRIEGLKIVPSHLEALLAYPEPHALLPRRVLVLGGEAATWSLADRLHALAPECTLLNHYGPTETTVGVLTHPVGAGGERLSTLVPLGRPLAETRVYVVDGGLRPLGKALAGEICLAGGGLARGYLGRPAETAERFIPDPFAATAGERLYRSGDLGRFLPGGEVEFLGRNDRQVKIHGVRVELGEVEAALLGHPGVRQAVAVVRERPGGARQLVAYVVLRARHGLTAASLRRAASLRHYLRERLLEPLVPGRLIFLPALPLTANGKIDHRALPEPAEETEERGSYAAPGTASERILERIWSEVLAHDRVSIHANFFDLGGDSITSIQIVARAHQAGLPCTPRQLLQHQTIAELAAVLAAAGAPPAAEPAALPAAAELPLAPMQRAMLFLAQLDPQAGMYLDQAVYTLRGDLDVAAFERAWRSVVERHAALRTALVLADLEEPRQRVEPAVVLPVLREDWRHLDAGEQEERLAALLRADRARGFDLTRAPLLRLALLEVAAAEHLVVWTFHHLILDGWSVGLVLHDVAAAYRACHGGREPDRAAAPPYTHFLRWLAERDGAADEAFWRRALAGFTAPTALPAALGGSAAGPVAAGAAHPSARGRLAASTSARLGQFAQRHRLTTSTLVQAAWALLLQRHSGETEVVFGATTSGRPPELPGVESMVGLFINTLPVRAAPTPQAPLLPWLAALQEAQFEARQHQHTPLVDIQRWSEVPRGVALFDTLVVFDNFPLDGLVGDLGEGVEADPRFRFHNRTHFALSLASWPAEEMPLELRYAPERCERAAVLRLLGHLQVLLAEMCEGEARRLSDLALLSEAEGWQLVGEWNDTAAGPARERSIVELFAAQVARRPQAAAVEEGVRVWSYREVARQASLLAGQLHRLGVGRGDLVGVHLQRCGEMVPALLGILLSGAAYVPVEVGLPVARVEWLLAALSLRWVVTQRARVRPLAALALPELAHLVLLDEGAEEGAEGHRDGAAEAVQPPLTVWPPSRWQAGPPLAGPAEVGSEDRAYIIFTSGSTGRPKGVAVQHGPVVNLIGWVNRRFSLGESDRVLFVTALGFDLSVYDVFGLLAAGGVVRVASEAELADPRLLAETLAGEPITFWDSAPAALQRLLPWLGEERPRSRLRLVFVSGDWVPLTLPGEMRRAFPRVEVVALGGATEAVVWSNFFVVDRVEAGWASIPYGRPIANAQYRVLDGELRACPIGVAGDLYIGGACLALGYAGEPELTALRFVPDAWGEEPGGRLYRTGDRARHRADGTLEFLGRLDQQIKIRGFRIELGEIEAALGEHPAVGEAVVVVRAESGGGRRLVAYVVARPGAAPTAAALRDHLRERLPDYMVPQDFVALARLPVTANGKLDRQALPAPQPPEPEAGHAAARTPTEELLIGIWGEVLGHDRVGIDDSFFALGGDSLSATRLLARLRAAFGVELPLRRLFDRPTPAGVGEELDGLLRAAAGPLPPPIAPLAPLPGEASPALSFAQERLWFLDQLEPQGFAYNIHAALHLAGDLDPRALAAAGSEMVRRHAVLRTLLACAAGEPRAVLRPPEPLALPLADLGRLPTAARRREALRLARQEAEQPFDLAAGPVLVRTRLLRLGREEHLLCVTFHHIASDGWSIGIAVRELAALYPACAARRPSPLPQPPIQYSDFARWQRRFLAGEVLAAQLSYWRQHLEGIPAALDLPTDRPRTAVQRRGGAALAVGLPADLADRLKRWSRERNLTLFMTLLAGFEALLARYADQPLFAVGIPTAGRQHAGSQELIGLFVNTLAVRADLTDDPGLGTLAARNREEVLAAQAHADLPFEKLVEELRPQRRLDHTPLFQVLFALDGAPVAPPPLPGLRLELLEVETAASKFELSLTLRDGPAGLGGNLRFRTGLFDRTTVGRLAAHLASLLAEAAAAPDTPLSRLAVLLPAERHQLTAEWNDTGRPGAFGACVHQMFEEWVAATPQATAVRCGERELSYRELDRHANRLAHRLRARGVGREVPVGILIEPSIAMVVALLGVLKAGGAYLGIDAALPAERVAFMLRDAGVTLLVVAEEPAQPPPAGVRVLSLSASDPVAEREDDPAAGVEPGDLAYVIYTSGSTGVPKGVAGQHSQLLGYLAGILPRLGPPAGATFAVQQSLAVDAPITYLFAALSHGGVVDLIGPALLADPAALASHFRRHPVDYLKIAPSHLATLLATGHGAAILPRRLLLVGGEASTWELVAAVRALGAGCEYLNHYGPTETTVGVLTHRAGEPAATSVLPLGRPLAGTRVFVLDRTLQPVPLGVAGELCIGGTGLARGYLGLPGLTADRFVPDPLGGGRGSRLYRTGDLARHLPNGELEFLGRSDHQVKIRGFRVELEEIETVLAQHPQVVAAVVTAAPEQPAGLRLVAFLVAGGEAPPAAGELRRFLRARLPEHMVPAAYVVLERLPRTPQGKIDRRALPQADAARPEPDNAYVAPRSADEAQLAALWGEVLGVARVGVRDDFFALGGHSLMAARLIARVREAFAVEVPLRSLFEAPTVEGLLERIVEIRAQAAAPGAAIAAVPRAARRLKRDLLR